MDRDVYLILIGAGISLTSSIFMLLLQFVLNLIERNIQRKREEEKQRREEIRRELRRRDEPIFIDKPNSFPSSRTRGGALKSITSRSSYPSWTEVRVFGYKLFIERGVFICSLQVGAVVFLIWCLLQLLVIVLR